MANGILSISRARSISRIRRRREPGSKTRGRRPRRSSVFAAFVERLTAHFSGPIAVAELGSGPGRLAAAILAGCDCRSYSAIDFSAATHDLARDHLGETAQRVRFLLEDFRLSGWSERSESSTPSSRCRPRISRHVSRVLRCSKPCERPSVEAVSSSTPITSTKRALRGTAAFSYPRGTGRNHTGCGLLRD